MQPVTISVGAPLAKIKGVLETDGLMNFFQVSHTKVIKWGEYDANHTVGKIAYLRRKKLSGFRFHIYFESVGQGTNVTVSVEPTAFFYKNKWIVYLAGLVMCGIGIIFPLVGFSLLDQRVNSIVADLCNSILTWNQS